MWLYKWGLDKADRAELAGWLASTPPWESRAGTVAAEGRPWWWSDEDEEGVDPASLGVTI